jgi:hypothetical protein
MQWMRNACRKEDIAAVKVMRRLVTSYFQIVQCTAQDLVPKIIMKCVVVHAEKNLHGHLVTNLIKCVGTPELVEFYSDAVSKLANNSVHMIWTAHVAMQTCANRGF